MLDLERRYARESVEFRATTKSGSAGVLVGYAAKYNTLSRNLGGFVETIKPGAFDKSVADGLDVMARYNHETLLGRTSSGTVRLSLDGTGLQYEVDLPDTSAGRDLAVLAQRGDVYQSSFAFYTHQDSWSQTDQGMPLRHLEAVQLVDVAPVDSPAYLDTSSGLRSFAEQRGIPMDEVASAAAEGRLSELMSPAPVDSDEVRAATDEDEGPQVANHGLVVVRRRLSLLMERRNP